MPTKKSLKTYEKFAEVAILAQRKIVPMKEFVYITIEQ
jgi:hypothetical protein